MGAYGEACGPRRRRSADGLDLPACAHNHLRIDDRDRRLAHAGELDVERGAAADLALDVDRASVLLDDGIISLATPINEAVEDRQCVTYPPPPPPPE